MDEALLPIKVMPRSPNATFKVWAGVVIMSLQGFWLLSLQLEISRMSHCSRSEHQPTDLATSKPFALNAVPDSNVPNIYTKDEVNKLLAEKANTSDVQTLQMRIETKADKSEVHELSSIMPDKSQVMTMRRALQNKANNSDVQTLRVAIDKKADKSKVRELSSTKADKSQVMTMSQDLQIKANNSDVQALRVAIEKKADQRDMQQLNTIKADKSKLADLNNRLMKTFEFIPMPPNLILNSFMNNLNGARPQGFKCFCHGDPWVVTPCSIQIEAVHPFTMCFEGPYCYDGNDTRNPSYSDLCRHHYPSRAATCNDATQSLPYIFGSYYMGSRVGRGGLSTGWGSTKDGKILKISGSIDTNVRGFVEFPRYTRILTGRVLFRAFLKVIKGKASFQTDVGVQPEWTAQTVATQTDGWLEIHELITCILDVYFFGVYGENPDNTGAFEMYLALPYMANVVEKSGSGGKQQSRAWAGAIEDQLVVEGLASWDNDALLSRANA